MVTQVTNILGKLGRDFRTCLIDPHRLGFDCARSADCLRIFFAHDEANHELMRKFGIIIDHRRRKACDPHIVRAQSDGLGFYCFGGSISIGKLRTLISYRPVAQFSQFGPTLADFHGLGRAMLVERNLFEAVRLHDLYEQRVAISLIANLGRALHRSNAKRRPNIRGRATKE